METVAGTVFLKYEVYPPNSSLSENERSERRRNLTFAINRFTGKWESIWVAQEPDWYLQIPEELQLRLWALIHIQPEP